MLNLPDDAIAALPVDERGFAVLRDLLDTEEWNEHNYLLSYQQRLAAARAVAEAMAWLRGRGFIARTPGQSSGDAIFVTARGQRALGQGIATVVPPNDWTASFIP